MIKVVHLSPNELVYLSASNYCLENLAPKAITALGNLNALSSRRLVALFCSVKCPGDLILKTYDLARDLRQAGVAVISGFHSPMERECLDILLRGTQPVIVCRARECPEIGRAHV